MCYLVCQKDASRNRIKIRSIRVKKDLTKVGLYIRMLYIRESFDTIRKKIVDNRVSVYELTKNSPPKLMKPKDIIGFVKYSKNFMEE